MTIIALAIKDLARLLKAEHFLQVSCPGDDYFVCDEVLYQKLSICHMTRMKERIRN